MNEAALDRGEEAVAEDLEVEHRCARAALDRPPTVGRSTAAASSQTITIVSFQPLEAAAGDAEHEARSSRSRR